MINWDNFYVFAAVSICLWLIGAVFALRSSTRSKTAIGFTSGGIIVLAVFITDYGSSCNVLRYALWGKPVCGTLSSWA